MAANSKTKSADTWRHDRAARRLSYLAAGATPDRRGWAATVLKVLCLAVAWAPTLVWPVAGLAAPKSEPKVAGRVTMQAFAEQAAIVPGQVLNLAVSLKVDDDWYIYWQNPGPDAGLPTKVTWVAPDGFQVGPTQYPVPRLKYDSFLESDANILEGTPLFLTAVRTPQSLTPGQEITLKARASWLVCKNACIRGGAEVSLILPVAARTEEAKPANEEVFERAKDSLPVPASQAKHLKLSGAPDRQPVKPGEEFTAALTVEIADKHHMQSHKPAQEGLIPAVVFVERTEGLQIGKVVYPKAHDRMDRVLGKMSEYSGRIVFRIPVKVAENVDAAQRSVRGIVQSQICSDTGTCYMPQYVAFDIPIKIEGGAREDQATSTATSVQETPMAEAEALPEAEISPIGKATPTEDQEIAGEGSSFLLRFQESLLALGYLGAILLAFLGGLLMNLMPCVLPVISLKVLSFVRQAHEHRWRVFRLGLTYAGGIMAFFVAFACLMFFGGIGWGELFQSPVFVLVVAAVVLALALSLFGVFTLFTPRVVSELGQKAESREGYTSAFSTGLLATLLGTACTAPLLSVAIAYASRQPALQGSLIFVAAGFGMALPFVILTFNPAWLRFVPKPGPWMKDFEHIMAFVLLATVIWLLYPLRGQLGDYGLYLSLIFLLAVAVAAWLKGKIEFGAPAERKARLYGAIVVCLLIGWMLPFRWMATVDALKRDKAERDELIVVGERARHGRQLDWSRGIPWQRYSRELALKDVADGYTVFVDYTADWCASCKTNKKTSLDVQETIKTMRDLGVIPYEADYTVRRPEITEDLKRFGRAGVPMYLVYRPGDVAKPEVLPELLTPGIVIDALKRAGPSRPTASAKP